MESVQLGVTVDTACNGLDIPSTEPCQGLYDFKAQAAAGKLEKGCLGSFTPIKESETSTLLEVFSNCQGAGNTIVSLKGDTLSVGTMDSCTTNETMYLAFGVFDEYVLGAFWRFCVGNSTSTQHFAGENDAQPLIVWLFD